KWNKIIFWKITVIKKWNFNPKASASEPSVLIEGRAEGIISWFFSLLKIDPTLTLKVENGQVIFNKGDFSGFERITTSLTNISSTVSGYEKPWKESLLIAVVLGAMLGSLKPLLAVVGIGLGLLYYILKKKLTVGFIINSGCRYDISFYRSVIENQSIDENTAIELCDYLDRMIREAQGYRSVPLQRVA
ncbi:MAG: hypothetical protein HQK54_18110, partial [Oligoflexales bacterium]|nr:hypothetical protein [Oligoflexales bacterium]